MTDITHPKLWFNLFLTAPPLTYLTLSVFLPIIRVFLKYSEYQEIGVLVLVVKDSVCLEHEYNIELQTHYAFNVVLDTQRTE